MFGGGKRLQDGRKKGDERESIVPPTLATKSLCYYSTISI